MRFPLHSDTKQWSGKIEFHFEQVWLPAVWTFELSNSVPFFQDRKEPQCRPPRGVSALDRKCGLRCTNKQSINCRSWAGQKMLLQHTGTCFPTILEIKYEIRDLSWSKTEDVKVKYQKPQTLMFFLDLFVTHFTAIYIRVGVAIEVLLTCSYWNLIKTKHRALTSSANQIADHMICRQEVKIYFSSLAKRMLLAVMASRKNQSKPGRYLYTWNTNTGVRLQQRSTFSQKPRKDARVNACVTMENGWHLASSLMFVKGDSKIRASGGFPEHTEDISDWTFVKIQIPVSKHIL